MVILAISILLPTLVLLYIAKVKKKLRKKVTTLTFCNKIQVNKSIGSIVMARNMGQNRIFKGVILEY